MQKYLRISLVLLLLFALEGAISLAASPAAVQARAARQVALASASGEIWNLGVTVEGPPTYPAIAGRLVSEVGAFRSARSATGATIFPASAGARTVQAARFYLLGRTGSYTGNVNLSLVIFNFVGVQQHIVSQGSIDLKTAPTGAWTPVTLSSNTANLTVSPGEFLAFTYTLSAAAGGDLDLRPIFEVSVY